MHWRLLWCSCMAAVPKENDITENKNCKRLFKTPEGGVTHHLVVHVYVHESTFWGTIFGI